LLRGRVLAGVAGSSSCTLFPATPQCCELLRTYQSIQLLVFLLAQLPGLLAHLLGSERAVTAHRHHLAVGGLVNLPELWDH
jgi:hypothetical protein